MGLINQELRCDRDVGEKGRDRDKQKDRQIERDRLDRQIERDKEKDLI